MVHLLLVIIYLAFISLGLPDSLLGSAWPVIYREFEVPVSYAGAIFIIISVGTIVSSLQSDRLTKRVGTGKVTAFSVLITAVALWGFSVSTAYWMLLVWAIPYGLGAGSVDASLNNFVALNYKSSHMSWLHCMWGVGASVGPYIMSFVLTRGFEWNNGYQVISLIQVCLTVCLFVSLPLWKKKSISESAELHNETKESLPIKSVLKITGVKQVMLMFFCYCAIEQTAGLWASSYFVIKHGLDSDTAAGFGSMFFIGITIGRAISGFVTMRVTDHRMIRIGQCIIAAGAVLMLLPLSYPVTLIGLIVIGLGCAPIYPCIIHSTPDNFGRDKSQAIIGVQMASAYTGNVVMPPLFGLIANNISISLLPVYLFVILALMVIMHISLNRALKIKAG